MLNSDYKWVEITPFGKVIPGGGDDSNDPDTPEPGNDVIYEGGII